MKKSYSTPALKTIVLGPESAVMFNGSKIDKSEETIDEGGFLSGDHAWDSSNWSGADDEEE